MGLFISLFHLSFSKVPDLPDLPNKNRVNYPFFLKRQLIVMQEAFASLCTFESNRTNYVIDAIINVVVENVSECKRCKRLCKN